MSSQIIQLLPKLTYFGGQWAVRFLSGLEIHEEELKIYVMMPAVSYCSYPSCFLILSVVELGQHMACQTGDSVRSDPIVGEFIGLESMRCEI
ncbi:hypothetical protein Nepgr_001674 [Nepenthes gracilis]|uniref:Uncharacterized protein n=1 Tax=Nepenthes gracilis TaxID=150966 RepID=A0AAD3P2Y5_NEPGR|nr:hypothetical protein Nepgr_001674 [Nepenthes gracilis]